MKTRKATPLLSVLLILPFLLSACGAPAIAPTSTPAPTDTREPTATITLTPTKTPKPSPTPKPTKTPNLVATQRMENFNAEAQSYFDKGYLKTASGNIKEIDDFMQSWAQLGWYKWWYTGERASDFYISAHVKWWSAFRNADDSGCGFAFAVQDNGDHYSVFLDRSDIVFLNADQTVGYSRNVGRTRGAGFARFDNPADNPVEADFTVIVNDAYTYVLVNGEVIGEYTLSQSRILNGRIALSILSGTNKDYGTRCKMTDIRVWTPK